MTSKTGWECWIDWYEVHVMFWWDLVSRRFPRPIKFLGLLLLWLPTFIVMMPIHFVFICIDIFHGVWEECGKDRS